MLPKCFWKLTWKRSFISPFADLSLSALTMIYRPTDQPVSFFAVFSLLLCRFACRLFFTGIRHIPTAPTFPAPEACLPTRWSPFCGASLGGSRWTPKARSPRSTDAWARWTWWPSVWAARWEPGSTSCLGRWPGNQRGPALSSPSSSPPWPPYSQGCAMQSLGLGFLKQAQRTCTATWPWGSCWPSSLGGICCFLTS